MRTVVRPIMETVFVVAVVAVVTGVELVTVLVEDIVVLKVVGVVIVEAVVAVVVKDLVAAGGVIDTSVGV